MRVNPPAVSRCLPNSISMQNCASLADQVAVLRVNQLPRKPVVCCFNYNQSGHIQRHCPVCKSQTHLSRCCGKVNHIEESADILTQDLWSGQQASLLLGHSNDITVAAVKHTNSIINITIGSKLVEAMLDSGSIISLIRQDTLTTVTVDQCLLLPPHNLVTATLQVIDCV